MSGKKGLMSSNVLNMKFMKQAEIKEEEKQIEQEEMKLRDLSEWKTGFAETLKSKGQNKPRIISVGYTNINSLSSRPPIVGRRVFGEKPKEEKQMILLDNKDEESSKKQDLNALWKKDRREGDSKRVVSNKRNQEDSPRNANKKRKSEA